MRAGGAYITIWNIIIVLYNTTKHQICQTNNTKPYESIKQVKCFTGLYSWSGIHANIVLQIPQSTTKSTVHVSSAIILTAKYMYTVSSYTSIDSLRCVIYYQPYTKHFFTCLLHTYIHIEHSYSRLKGIWKKSANTCTFDVLSASANIL